MGNCVKYHLYLGQWTPVTDFLNTKMWRQSFLRNGEIWLLLKSFYKALKAYFCT